MIDNFCFIFTTTTFWYKHAWHYARPQPWCSNLSAVIFFTLKLLHVSMRLCIVYYNNCTYAYLPVFSSDLRFIIYLFRGIRKRIFPNNGYNNFNGYADQWRVKISETRNRAVKTKHRFFVNSRDKIMAIICVKYLITKKPMKYWSYINK